LSENKTSTHPNNKPNIIIDDIQTRNKTIAKAYKQGYSQHMIAKVLGMTQSTISAITKGWNAIKQDTIAFTRHLCPCALCAPQNQLLFYNNKEVESLLPPKLAKV